MADERRISLELFSLVKPTCVELSQVSSLPPADLNEKSPLLIQHLQTLCNQLDQHKNRYDKHEYVLSSKIADYIFFPLTNMLKQPTLDPDATKHVLHIIAFLLENSWMHQINEALLDQLSPIIVFLCRGTSLEPDKALVSTLSLQFKQEVVLCLNSLVHCFPRTYYTGDTQRRLSILGDITTILLDILGNIPQPLDQEKNELADNVITCLTWLYSVRVTSEQTSFVFPGVISKMVNFVVTSKNLHANTLQTVFQLLQTFIIKVFSDSSLDASVLDLSPNIADLSSLKALYDEKPDNTDSANSEQLVSIKISTPESSHRTKSWLSATSRQLKIALITLFRHILIKRGGIRDKIVSHEKLQDALFLFIKEINAQCSQSLFANIIITSIDFTSLLIHCISKNHVTNEILLRKGTELFIVGSASYLTLLHKVLTQKTDDLISSQLDRILLSADDDKIGLTLVSIQLHLQLLDRLSARIGITSSGSEPRLRAVQKLYQGILSKERLLEFSTDGKRRTASGINGPADTIGDVSEELQNTLDSVVLPLHINARSVKKFLAPNTAPLQNRETNLALLLRTSVSMNKMEDAAEIRSFSSSFTTSVYDAFQNFVNFIGASSEDITSLIDNLLLEDDGLIKSKGVFLWLSNHLLMSSRAKREAADISDFITFSDDLENNSEEEEAGYLILDYARTIFDEALDARKQWLTPDIKGHQGSDEMSYAIALQSLGSLSKVLSKRDFESDVLMDNLYLLLEAMTQGPNSIVHHLAKKALFSITKEYYEGSLQKLIEANSDYLIDSLSLKLSVMSDLTPSLPGIMLLVLKISGADLVKSNQLTDILSEVFLAIDSFHGYSVLVENFFLVFQEVIALIKKMYSKELLDHNKLKSSTEVSPFKPWGMRSRNQFVEIIDEKNRQADPFSDYDPEKEYFKRKPGVPFGDQDSDDDSDDDQSNTPTKDEDKPWPSPIPKETYNLVLQIFKYGLQLLTHPSIKLRLTIFETLKDAYIMVASNYDQLMPVMAEFWPIIMAKLSGTSTISDWEHRDAEFRQLMEPAIEFANVVFEEDSKHGSFMSRRFLDTWEFLSKKGPFFQTKADTGKSKAVISTSVAPSVRLAYVKLFVTALNNYERQIPHQTAIEIARVCVRLGINETKFNLSRDIRSSLWVIKNYR